MSNWRTRLGNWLLGTTAAVPAPPEPDEPKGLAISSAALWEARRTNRPVVDVARLFERPRPAPGVLPAGMAMDFLPPMGSLAGWAMAEAYNEGLAFLGYPYLAQLAQRAEYRRMAEIWAEHTTRRWIKLRGPDPKRIDELNKFWEGHRDENGRIVCGLGVRAAFREAAEIDAMMGRAQIYIDTGANVAERAAPLMADARKVSTTKPIRALKVVEPSWSYPGQYNSTDPLDSDHYKPRQWYVMGTTVSDSRMLTVVGREVPDLLKPSYAFGGLSLTQMAKPYVDNWLRTRQSVSDITHSYSLWVVKTDMSAVLGGGSGKSVFDRVDLFNEMRDNRGAAVIDKNEEEIANVTTPLSGLDKLQAQAQEQMSSVSGIPLVVLLGVTPSGLNASSDGEIRTFYAAIKGWQEKNFRPLLQRLLDLSCLSLFGELQPDVTFEFLDLWEPDGAQRAAERKSDADADSTLVTAGALGPEDVRGRLAKDEHSPYYGIAVADVPEQREPDDEEDDADDTTD